MASSLQRLLSRYGPDIDREIEQWISRSIPNAQFAGMMRYQFGYVDENLAPARVPGGKRFRPVLCLLACQAVGGDWHSALPAASSIEILHNFSLVHDDIEDRDPYRRHRPTAWKVWGEPQAINVGDGMFAVSVRAGIESARDPGVAVRVASRLLDASLTLTEGQYLDMSFEGRPDVTAEDYRAMIDRKTAALLEFSLWCGAVIGGGAEQVVESLATFGCELGRAFQMLDDIQGIWAPAAATGKEASGDLHNRKKTLPVLLAMDRADSDQLGVLRRYYAGEDDDIGPVHDVLARTGVRQAALERVEQLLSSAMQNLDASDIADQARQDLAALAHELVGQPFLRSRGTVTNV